MFCCFTNMNPHSVAHLSNQTSYICSGSNRAGIRTHIWKQLSLQWAYIIHSWDFITLIYTYKYFGVFDPETMPRADPVWIPIRSCNRALGMWGILKTIDAHKRSKAMDAISETCLFPTIMKLHTLNLNYNTMI